MSGALGREKAPRAWQLRHEGLTNRQVAERLGVSSVGTVYNTLGPAPQSAPRQHPDHLRDRALSLRWRGYSVRRIAYLLDLPPSTIGDWVKSHG